eukprot:753491-Hanusia_phi.AAC.6
MDDDNFHEGDDLRDCGDRDGDDGPKAVVALSHKKDEEASKRSIRSGKADQTAHHRGRKTYHRFEPMFLF